MKNPTHSQHVKLRNKRGEVFEVLVHVDCQKVAESLFNRAQRSPKLRATGAHGGIEIQLIPF